MKKIIALLLIVMLVLSMAGCSGEGEKSNTGTQASSSDAANKDEQGSAADDNSGDNGNASYTLYDDLPNYEKLIFHETYISTPAWRCDTTRLTLGWRLTDSNDYVVAITYNDDDDGEYTGAIEDILEETYDGFTSAIGDHAVTNEFGEYNLTTKEKVTLDCGSEAMKFEGTMSANEYSAIVDYYIYGYSFVFDKSTITVGASVVNPDVIDEKKDMMKDIVDRMVKTVRTQP
ncbi:MAG: hypothetical protein ACI39E_02170 [Acutalibacteraceae bacterium]